ncbi:hypothetical protein ACFW6Q_25760 [Streptomyces sp. NPDC058737]|uniref:hypothetical protein n=1 Tax=Streptomyces sp. NPDC058737 TaxID=3346617 RepID=UPI0036C89102
MDVFGTQSDVRAEHHVVVDLDAADLVEAAALVHEDVAAHPDVHTVVGVDGRDQVEGPVHRLPGEFARSPWS